jgi:hypothetical protein
MRAFRLYLYNGYGRIENKRKEQESVESLQYKKKSTVSQISIVMSNCTNNMILFFLIECKLR